MKGKRIIILKRISSVLISFMLVWGYCINTFALTDGNKAENDFISPYREAEMRLREGFENFFETVDLSDLDIMPESLGTIFLNVIKNHPYLFYVDRKLSYTYHTGGAVISVVPKYNCSKAEAYEMINFCKGEIKKMASLVMGGRSELEKVLLAHDLLCRKFSYDLTLESNNIYSFLKNGTGTCQGYTWTYMALLREMGIECEYAASDTIVHIWLRVKIDGEWYNSDVTWDDPPADEDGNAEITRKHFLFSDTKADKDGYHDRYGYGTSNCKSDKYDAFDFSEILLPCYTDGDIDHSGAVELYDIVNMRRYFAGGENRERICPICSDADDDLLLTINDIDVIRELVLTSRGE